MLHDKSRDAFAPRGTTWTKTEALLVLGCGGAAQIMRELTEEYGMTIPVKTGLESVGHMDTRRFLELAVEQCRECGQCMLNETGAICPMTEVRQVPPERSLRRVSGWQVRGGHGAGLRLGSHLQRIEGLGRARPAPPLHASQGPQQIG